MQYIIATHHDMASGILDAVRILKGDYQNIHVLNAYVENDNFSREYENCLDKIDKNEKIIVLTDLAGGSVNQIVMKTKTRDEVEIIAGVNIDIVLSVLSIDEKGDIPAQIRDAIGRSREQMIYINKLVKSIKKGDINGI